MLYDDLILKIFKISIIIFVSIYLIGNIVPYFEGSDSFVYGITAIQLSQGSYGITNELLQNTGHWEFVPFQWVKTNQNVAVPGTNIGLPVIGAFFYLIGGYGGLFYLGPIFTILLLISSERIASNLFGKYVGLLTLIFVATNLFILRVGTELLTDNIFTLFFIWGCFYLIKFFQNKKENHLLFASIFFTIATFMRITGAISLPIEIILVGGYFLFQIKIKKNHEIHTKTITIKPRKILKTIIFITVPWILFLLFWFSYNNYYFGDPMTNYNNIVGPYPVWYEKGPPSSFFEFDSQRYEFIKGYSKFLLPYPISAIHQITENYDEVLGKNFLGIISILIIISSLAVSLNDKNKRMEIIVLATFIVLFIGFFSSSYITPSDRILYGLIDRYVIPIMPLFFMMLGYLIIRILKRTSIEQTYIRNLHNTFKILFIGFLIAFFGVAFYYSPPLQLLENEDFTFKDPGKLDNRYPLNLEGLSKNSVVVVTKGSWAVDYGATPFNPFWGYRIAGNFDPTLLHKESIDILKETISEGYDVYVFKKSSYHSDKPFFKYLSDNHGIILKNYSNTFCKMELRENNNDKTDEICI